MLDNLIQNALSYGLVLLTSIFFLSACSRTPEVEAPPPVEVRTVQDTPPAPIVPDVDRLNLRTVNWRVITPENIEEVFESLTRDVVLFAITSDGYEALSLNLSDLRAMIQQQQRIIAIYERSFR